MNTVAFRRIVGQIQEKERIALGTLASELNIHRSYLSRILNTNDSRVEISDKLLIKLAIKYGRHLEAAVSNGDVDFSLDDVKLVTLHGVQIASLGLYGEVQKVDQQQETVNSGRLDPSDRELLLEIVINQKATLQYLREIQGQIAEKQADRSQAAEEVKDLIRKGKSSEKDRQSKR